MALPAVIANLLMTAFHNVDTFWIGRSLGADALAAVTGAIFWVWLVISIGEMVSIGLDAVAARRHGERRPQDAARTVSDGFMLALLLGAAIAIATPFLMSWLFTMLGTNASVSTIGREYLGTYFLGMPLIFGFFAVDAAFRAKGDTRTPLWILAVTTILALVLDPLLIRGWGPFPAMGVRGAAMATLVPRGLGCLAGVLILKRRGMIAWTLPRWSVLATILRVGAPAAATGIVFSFIYVLLTRITTQFGTPALAALGLGFRMESVIYVASVGMGAAVAAIVGQSLGAGDSARAARAGWLSTAVVSVLGVVIAVASLLFAEEFAGIFSNDPAVIAEAARYLRISAFSQLFLGAEVVLESAMAGAGWTFVPMLLSTGITALRLPIGAWAAATWGTTGLWWTLAVTAAARGVLMVLLWAWGRWRTARV
ncbi:MAG: MATE family efflux transporter [Gemmatimonas sp.]|uniref:MATE family efflux transporter n=1 Tax=Gemmatimonas sp. TaxID=1962908 RepID=UPI0031BF46A4|nr:MATE family efflux transporter [Gemmatimonas sp.]